MYGYFALAWNEISAIIVTFTSKQRMTSPELSIEETQILWEICTKLKIGIISSRLLLRSLGDLDGTFYRNE